LNYRKECYADWPRRLLHQGKNMFNRQDVKTSVTRLQLG
jgi:hypothetical protein